MTQTRSTVSFTGGGQEVPTVPRRFTQLGTAVVDGHAPTLGAIIVLTIWPPASGSYAVPSYRRRAGTI